MTGKRQSNSFSLTVKPKDGKAAASVRMTPSAVLFDGNEDKYVEDTLTVPVTVRLEVDGHACNISSVSFANKPSGVNVSVSVSTTTSKTIDVVNSASDFSDIEGCVDVTLTGSYDGQDYTATGSLPIAVLKAGQNGSSGDTIRTIEVFKRSDTQPEAPTANAVADAATAVADGWSVTPPTSTPASGFSSITVDNSGLNTRIGGMTAWEDTVSSDPNYSTFGDGWRIAKGNSSNDSNSMYVVDRICFTPISASETFRMEIAASAEMGYDGVLVGNIGTAATVTTNWGTAGLSTKGKAAKEVVSVSISVDGHAGETCYVDVVFRKDSSQHSNDDCGYYRILSTVSTASSSGRIWASAATLVNGVVKRPPGWSAPVKWDGEKGNDGANAEWWELRERDGVSEVEFKSDFAGGISGSPSEVVLQLVHHTGSTEEVLGSVPSGFQVQYLTDGNTWTAISLGTRSTESDCSDGSWDAVYRLLKSGVETGGRVKLHCRWRYQRMLLPAGIYTSKEYTRDSMTTPLVLHESSGEYWFLDADTNKVGSSYIGPKDSNQKVWARANYFDVVLAKMLFAQFAELGGFIVYGNYFFSRYGTLVARTSETAVRADNVDRQYGGKVPYGWFDSTDPMVSSTPSSGYKFRPMKCINALTGEEWAAGGNVHFDSDGNVDVSGTIRAKNLFHGVCVNGMEEYAYCYISFIDYLNSDDDLSVYADNFNVGKYYTDDDIRQLTDDNVGIEAQGLTRCTYDADIVIVPNRYNNSSTRYVYLPRAQDFAGKVVEVYDNAYANGYTMGDIVVRAVADGKFGSGVYPSGISNMGTSVTIRAGGRAKFYSIYKNYVWYWLKVSEDVAGYTGSFSDGNGHTLSFANGVLTGVS